MRTRAIKDALGTAELTALRQRLVSPEAIEAEGARTKFLVSWRVATGPKKAGQKVVLEKDFAGLQRTLEELHEFGFLVVPIGRLLKELAEKVRNY